MDEQQLWAAVLANPESMEPRRALANLWGGDRERFILQQIVESDGLRQGRKVVPVDTDHLLRGNERAWGGPIVDRVHRVHFRRGLVEWIVVDAAQFVREWKELLALAPIRHLTIANAGPVVDELFASPGLDQIVGLSFNLAGTPLHDPVGAPLVPALTSSPHLKKLRYLDLQYAGLDEAARAAVTKATNLPALEMLQIDGLLEELGTDWDGTLVDIRPSQSLYEFEQRHGRCEWLHAAERAGREVTRESF